MAHRPSAHMMAQGMEPAAALQAATLNAAALLAIPDVGVIEEGTNADLLLVRGNPLSDVTCLADVRDVWAGGRRLADMSAGSS